jgi:glycosyltransferase involved in cell wall biosynthesis
MTEQPKPLVSIITPTFNQVRYLEASIRSVLAQDYSPIEYIVVDGGSTDGSREILERYANRLTRWISEPDAGQADAINKGFRMARGDILAWLNSDDLYLPGAVAEAVNALIDHPAAGMVYADGVLIDEEARLLDWHRYRTYDLVDLLSFDVLLQPTAFLRREALEAAGGLQTGYRLILDHDLWVRIARRFPIVHIPRLWAAERTHPEAKTMAAAAEFADEARRLIGEADRSPDLRAVIGAHRARVQAGLECFAARRMIDAGRYGEALRLFAGGFRRRPATALRFWYKILQATMGLVGLEGAFLWYRRTRRRLQHGPTRLDLGEGAPRIVRSR